MIHTVWTIGWLIVWQYTQYTILFFQILLSYTRKIAPWTTYLCSYLSLDLDNIWSIFVYNSLYSLIESFHIVQKENSDDEKCLFSTKTQPLIGYSFRHHFEQAKSVVKKVSTIPYSLHRSSNLSDFRLKWLSINNFELKWLFNHFAKIPTKPTKSWTRARFSLSESLSKFGR